MNFYWILDKGRMEMSVNKNLLVLVSQVYSSKHFPVYKRKKTN